MRRPVDGHAKELELLFYQAELAPSMGGIKVVLLPINGDADLFLSFSEPNPDRGTATWVDESVGVKQFTLPAANHLYCPANEGRALVAGTTGCKLYVGVSGFEEGDFKLFLYNYTQEAPTAGGDSTWTDPGLSMTGDFSCAPGCDDLRLGDTVCDPACNVTNCVWDGGDCGDAPGYRFGDNCATGCPLDWLGDVFCDEACFNEACDWDGGDCAADEGGCGDGCLPTWIDDRECDATCNTEACGWDGRDCEHGTDECYHDQRGIDYRGPVSVSASGWPCQVWAAQWPNAHAHSHVAFPKAGLGGHNSCRNPGNEEVGPWCYTIGGPRWELCAVPPPDANCSTVKGDFRTQCPVDCAWVLGNNRCDVRCNISSCAFDAGDCGVGLSMDEVLAAAAKAGGIMPASLASPYGVGLLAGGVALGVGVGLLILRVVLARRKKEEVKLRGYTIEEMKGMDSVEM